MSLRMGLGRDQERTAVEEITCLFGLEQTIIFHAPAQFPKKNRRILEDDAINILIICIVSKL